MNLKDALRAQWNAREHVLPDAQRFDPRVCQCCGYAKRTAESPECVCDGIDWHMLPGGGVECQAHRFARSIGMGKKSFLVGRCK